MLNYFYLFIIEKKTHLSTASFTEILFIVSGTVSIGYIIIIALVFICKKPYKPTSDAINEGVSIIIAAHNEIHNLKAFLPYILFQSYPVYEVIIACDRCTDGSVDFLRSLKNPSLKIIEINNCPDTFQPKKWALTQAIQQASYKWILATDADCYPQHMNWISSMMEAKGNKEICLGFSLYLPKPSFLNRFIRFETVFTAIQYGAWAIIGKPYMAVGRNLLYAKELFINNNGFGKHSNHLGGDDDLLIQKIASGSNSSISVTPESFTLSPPPEGFRQWWHQKHRHMNTGKQYPILVLTGLGIYPVFSLIFHLSGIYYISTFNFEVILPFYILRTCIFICIFVMIGHRWNYKLSILFLAIAEIFYLIYLLFAGVYNLAIPITKWK
jgi:glycosyltransferase involved in cell wall biosynthesis